MRSGHKRRDVFSLTVSIGVHVLLVSLLAIIPANSKKHYDTVDLSVSQAKTKEPPPKEPEVEPEDTVEPEENEKKTPTRKRVEKDPTEQAPPDEEPPPAIPPDADKAPENAEEAPPVFDLGDNTFASGEGQGAGWSLNRSEGNTKFAGVAKKEQPSVRGTKPKGDEDGKPGGKGTGYAPVPIKDLSKRPMPKSGNIKVPSYPSEARREGIEGAVVLQVFIGKNGSVKRVRVIKDPGGGLGGVAKVAMMKEKWTPPLDKNGVPVDTVIIYSYRFVLDG